MKFYNRNRELSTIEQLLKQSRNESRMTVIMGRRRIGKTELARKCGDSTLLYFFVARKTENLLCQDFVREAEEQLGIPIGWPSSFAELFRYLLKYSEQHPFTLIIDEFQDFQKISPSVFSEIQREWDIHKSTARMNLIISGSIFSLMKRIFEEKRRSPYRNYVRTDDPDRDNVAYILAVDTEERIEQACAALEREPWKGEYRIRKEPARECPGYALLKIYDASCSREAMLRELERHTGTAKTVTFGGDPQRYDVYIEDADRNLLVRELKRRFEPVDIRGWREIIRR